MPLVPSSEYRSVMLPSMPFDMDFSNDGTLLACATHSDDQATPVLRILRTDDGVRVKAFMQPADVSCKGVAFLAQGKELVFLMQREEGSTELFRAALTSHDPDDLQSYGASAHNHSIVRDFAATRFAVLGNHVEVWDAETGEVIRQWPGAGGTSHVHAAFSRDGSHLYVYGTAPKEVVRYDVSSGRESGRWKAPTPFGAQVLITPDERFLAVVGSSYKGIFVYDLFRGERVSAGPNGVAKLNERTEGWPWATSPDSSLLVCQKLSPWAFRLPDLFHYRPSTKIVAPGARCLSAAWAWDAPLVAFGTLEDATVRWFQLVEAEGDPAERGAAEVNPGGSDGGASPTSSRER
jgi:WD40 repeat protein